MRPIHKIGDAIMVPLYVRDIITYDHPTLRPTIVYVFKDGLRVNEQDLGGFIWRSERFAHDLEPVEEKGAV